MSANLWLILVPLTILALVVPAAARLWRLADFSGLFMQMPILRRHRLRQIMAAEQGLAVLKDSLGPAGAFGGTFDKADADSIGSEIDKYLSALPPFDARILPLWRRDGSNGGSPEQLASYLDRLIRALRARRVSLAHDKDAAFPFRQPITVAVAGTDASSAAPPAQEEGGADEDMVAKPDRRAALTIPEAAILATLTERFYSSWAFKVLAFAVLAGLALATGGSFIIGGQSIRLSEKLQDEYQHGSADLKKIDEDAQQDLKQKSDALKQANQDTEAAAAKYIGDVKKAEKDLESSGTTLKAELESSALQKVVEQARNDLKEQTDPALRDVRKQKDDFDDRMRLLRNGLADAEGALHRTAGVLDEDTKGLDGLTSRLASLDGEVEKSHQRANDILTAASKAEPAAQDALLAAGKAQQAQGDAESSRALIDKRLKEVDGLISQQTGVLGKLKEQSASLQAQIDKTRASLADMQSESGRVMSLENSVALIGQRVDRIEHQTVPDHGPTPKDVNPAPSAKDNPSLPPVPAPARHGGKLTVAEVCAIQTALNAQGFQVDPVDGHGGPNTNHAIQAWRLQTGSKEDGALKPEEIDRLIGGGDVPPCPPLAHRRTRPARRKVAATQP